MAKVDKAANAAPDEAEVGDVMAEKGPCGTKLVHMRHPLSDHELTVHPSCIKSHEEAGYRRVVGE